MGFVDDIHCGPEWCATDIVVSTADMAWMIRTRYLHKSQGQLRQQRFEREIGKGILHFLFHGIY